MGCDITARKREKRKEWTRKVEVLLKRKEKEELVRCQFKLAEPWSSNMLP